MPLAPSPRRLLPVVAVLALALPAALVVAPSTAATDTTATSTAGTGAAAAASAALGSPWDGCTPAERRALRRAGDRFGVGCAAGRALDLPPGLPDLTGLLAVDEEAGSPNLSLISHTPRSGAFAGDGAYNTDLAFQGRFAYAGNYEGFSVFDISRPRKPRLVTQVVCPGAQNDVSVYRNLLILSVDAPRTSSRCDAGPGSASQKSSWEGIRVFDISRPARPRYVAAVETACGSHTHSLAPTRDGKRLFVYVSSYSPNSDFPDCRPPHDKISIVAIPLAKPARARVAATPVLFPDGGNPGTGLPLLGVGPSETSGCHDLTVFPSRDLAAGACMGDGVLLDIRRRLRPRVISRVTDDVNFSFWHSATFNNAGTKVVFTDELGGGSLPTCNPVIGQERGANGIYDIVGERLEFRSYYKIPRSQALTENCVAHNGSLIPVPGRDIMVQAWYQGGLSVFDFTDSRDPREIAWFDRGPISRTDLTLGGNWSTYWHNGFIYSNEIHRGFDVYRLDDPRTNAARSVRMGRFNPQSQPRYRR